MKKFYSTLALVCAVGVTAFAATPVAEKKASKLVCEIQTVDAMKSIPASSRVKAALAPQKVAASVEDIEGFYDVDYESMFTSGKKDKTTATITAVSEDQILIQMEPYCSGYSNISMDPLLAEYDASTGTIILRLADNEDLGTYIDDPDNAAIEYHIALDMYNRVPNPNEPGKYYREDLEEITGILQADGSIVFGDADTCFGFELVEMRGAYVGGFMAAKFIAPGYFKFVADEWENLGDAEFTDEWLNLLIKEEYADARLQTRNIPLMKNKANPDLFLVQNPYQGWEDFNEDPTDTGYIVFSMENPDLVYLLPLTSSGCWLTLDAFPEDLYIFNLEGLYIENRGYTLDELVSMFAENDIEASKYDADTQTLTIRNILFGTTSEPGATYSWNGPAGDGVIKIKSDKLMSGVKAVSLDESNGPKRFFNLQGVEIANPASGELVIVKEGNKTSKVIVR